MKALNILHILLYANKRFCLYLCRTNALKIMDMIIFSGELVTMPNTDHVKPTLLVIEYKAQDKIF
jgi:hypothetical protein